MTIIMGWPLIYSTLMTYGVEGKHIREEVSIQLELTGEVFLLISQRILMLIFMCCPGMFQMKGALVFPPRMAEVTRVMFGSLSYSAFD